MKRGSGAGEKCQDVEEPDASAIKGRFGKRGESI